MGIGETLHQALAKRVMRTTGDQAKTACGKLQLCAGLEAGIEGTTQAVGKRRLARVRERRAESDKEEVAGDEEEDRGGISAGLNNLTIETTGTEEEAATGLAVALKMQV